jgi:hypothetical protein
LPRPHCLPTGRRSDGSELKVGDLGRLTLVDVGDDVGVASRALWMDSHESVPANLALAVTAIDCIAMGIQTGP